MPHKPSEEDDKAAEAEFQRVLGNLAAMPPKPHQPLNQSALKPKQESPAKRR